MNLSTYLTKHDGKPRPDGPECIRLAESANVSSYYLYLAALGHKKFSPNKALALHLNSIGGQIHPSSIRPDVEWHRDDSGQIASYSFRVKVA